jgi:metallo-beta-lactamase family protein
MKITFQGAAKIVTGSCYLFEVGKTKFLVDCGMFQGNKETTKLNYEPFRFCAKEISFVLLTHAHIDHSGLLPKLVNEGFKGKIYATNATKDLCKILLEDSAQIQKESIEHENKMRLRQGLPPREPLYKAEDIKKVIPQFINVKYDKRINLSNIEVCFRRAGHILGSTMIEIFVDGKKIVFSGDLGQNNSLILEDPYIMKDADYLFMESTYGNRLHEHVDKRLQKLSQIIKETYDKKGILMIPVFAIERTQEILFSLEELYKKKMIPRQKIILDSPLAIKATQIFRKYPQEYDKKISFDFKGLEFSPTQNTSMRLNSLQGPAVIMAGAGMCNAGRIRHHIKHRIWDKRNTILFVGYQAEGTLGDKIKSGEKDIHMMGIDFRVKAKVESIDSFSGHADQRMLLTWIKGFKKRPKKVFIIHGEEEASGTFAEKIEKLGMKTHIPYIGETIIL